MEIEIKAICENKKAVKTKLKEFGATKGKQKHQIDEYYNHPSRDTRKTKEYIRLRYNPDSEEGVFAYHLNISDGVTKEFEIKIDNVKTFKEILEKLGFPLLGVIDKQRETYNYNEFKVTLDDVKDIGMFVEIEADGDKTEIPEKKEQCAKLLEQLGISKDKINNNIWLSDIATGRTKLEK